MNHNRMVAALRYAALLCLLLLPMHTVVAAANVASMANAPSIDTPIQELLENPKAKQIVEKYLPNLVKALEENYDIADYLGTSSLRELSIDDDHVVVFDEEMLAALRKELSALKSE